MFNALDNRRRRGSNPTSRSQLEQAPWRVVRGVSSFALVLVAIVLLVLSRSDNRLLAQWRVKLLDLSAPLLEVVFVPAGYVQRSLDRMAGFYSTETELARLRSENERLRSMKWGVEELRQRNSELEALLNSIDAPQRRFVTGRIVSGNASPFGSSAIIKVGRSAGIGDGNAVVSAEGLVGRTSETGEDSSRLLLLTDRLSRIPVVIGRDGIRAIMTGDGTPEPALEFLPVDATLAAGDPVLTSGDGGGLPRGLQVGSVHRVDGFWRVALRVRLQGLEFVSVLLEAQQDQVSKR